MMDKHLRSVLKGISWRVTGTIDTILISLIITGKVKIALAIGGVEIITKIFMYYVHERVWERIAWGRRTLEMPEISSKENVKLITVSENP